MEFEDVPKGYYNVCMRMKLHGRNSANFDGKWTLTPLTKDSSNKYAPSAGEQVLYEHDKNDPKWTKCIGKGWMIFTFGTCKVTEDNANLRFRCVGGNPYWFSGMELDWILLVPTGEPETKDEIIFKCNIESPSHS